MISCSLCWMVGVVDWEIHAMRERYEKKQKNTVCQEKHVSHGKSTCSLEVILSELYAFNSLWSYGLIMFIELYISPNCLLCLLREVVVYTTDDAWVEGKRSWKKHGLAFCLLFWPCFELFIVFWCTWIVETLLTAFSKDGVLLVLNTLFNICWFVCVCLLFKSVCDFECGHHWQNERKIPKKEGKHMGNPKNEKTSKKTRKNPKLSSRPWKNVKPFRRQ